MLRRALALGAGLVVLILIVLGVKGCLDARAHRALTGYARDVEQIVNSTEQTSKDFFGKLENPGDLSVTEFTNQVDADRSAMDSFESMTSVWSLARRRASGIDSLHTSP